MEGVGRVNSVIAYYMRLTNNEQNIIRIYIKYFNLIRKIK